MTITQYNSWSLEIHRVSAMSPPPPPPPSSSGNFTETTWIANLIIWTMTSEKPPWVQPSSNINDQKGSNCWMTSTHKNTHTHTHARTKQQNQSWKYVWEHFKLAYNMYSENDTTDDYYDRKRWHVQIVAAACNAQRQAGNHGNCMMWC